MNAWGFQVRGDLGLNATGTDFTLVTGVNAARQEIQNGLTVFLGEWEYDVTAGLPYFQGIFVKPGDTRVIRAIYAKWLADRTNVTEVLRCDVSIDTEIRKAFVDFEVRCNDGQILSDRLPFVLVNR